MIKVVHLVTMGEPHAGCDTDARATGCGYSRSKTASIKNLSQRLTAELV